MTRYWLNLVFTALWGADTALTIAFTNKLGLAAETNPLMHWVLATWGVGGFIGVKITTLVAWLALQRHLRHLWIHWIFVLMMIPTVIGGFIIATGA
jgi:hypothetical protein